MNVGDNKTMLMVVKARMTLKVNPREWFGKDVHDNAWPSDFQLDIDLGKTKRE